jgi:hypothetical protein
LGACCILIERALQLKSCVTGCMLYSDRACVAV